jgi:hypothetical protein
MCPLSMRTTCVWPSQCVCLCFNRLYMLRVCTVSVGRWCWWLCAPTWYLFGEDSIYRKLNLWSSLAGNIQAPRFRIENVNLRVLCHLAVDPNYFVPSGCHGNSFADVFVQLTNQRQGVWNCGAQAHEVHLLVSKSNVRWGVCVLTFDLRKSYQLI